MRLIEAHRFTQVQLILDLVDGYAANRGLRGDSPRPMGSIRLLALPQSPKLDFTKAVELIVKYNTQGYLLFFGEVRLPNGTRHRHYLRGEINVYVISQYYQTQKLSPVTLPAPPTPDDQPQTPIITPKRVILEPSYAYPFAPMPQMMLRGHVQDSEKRKAANVTVTAVIDNKTYTYSLTDRTGQWLLLLPDVPAGSTKITFTLKKDNQEIQDIKREIDLQPGKSNNIKEPLEWSF